MKSMMRWLGMLGAFAAVLTMGWFGGWWDNFRPGKTVSKTTIVKPPAPSIQIARTQLTGWDSGHKLWEIEAAKIWQGNNGDMLTFERVTDGIIFSVKGRRVDFKAGWARFEKFANQLIIGGGITARIHEGTLETQEAVMDFRTGEMLCRQEVRFRGKEATMQAARITLNFNREELHLDGGVELTQNENSLRAGGIQYNLKTDEYRLIEPKGVTLKL